MMEFNEDYNGLISALESIKKSLKDEAEAGKLIDAIKVIESIKASKEQDFLKNKNLIADSELIEIINNNLSIQVNELVKKLRENEIEKAQKIIKAETIEKFNETDFKKLLQFDLPPTNKPKKVSDVKIEKLKLYFFTENENMNMKNESLQKSEVCRSINFDKLIYQYETNFKLNTKKGSKISNTGGAKKTSKKNVVSICRPEDYEIVSGVLLNYKGNDAQVKIIDGITSIGQKAFKGCKNLKQVIIPASVTKIEFEAFRGCKNLTKIIIPSSVESIGDGAFDSCKNLKHVGIPDNVVSIGEEVFYGFVYRQKIYVNKENSKNWNANWKGECHAEIIYR